MFPFLSIGSNVMLTPFSSGVTPTASLKTNSSDQRMSPAFAGAQPLAEGQTPQAAALPTIGLEPEALLVNVKTETAIALNQTVLQTLAAAVAAQMGVERLPDELLEAFFIRLAAAIEKRPLSEQEKIELQAGLKALQIPLKDLAPALRDPSGPVAARLTARAEAPMAAPQKTAAAEITDSYLQTGSTPARSAETVAMGERNKLSSDSGSLLFQNAAPKAAEVPADKASQTQLRTLFAPDAAGFERAPTTAATAANAAPNISTPPDPVARRGAGPVASGQESLAAAGPDLPETISEEDRPSLAAAAAKAYIRDAETEPTEFAMRKMPSASALPERQAFPGKTFAPSGDVKQGPSLIPQVIESETQPMAAKPVGPQVERLVTPNAPPLAPVAEFVEKIEDGDLQKRLIHMLSATPSASEEGAPDLTDFKRLPEGKNLVAPKDPTEMASLRDDFVETAGERASRSRDVIGSTLLPAQTATSQAEVAQRPQAGAHFGVPFGYVTTPPAAEGYETEKTEEKERRRGEQGAGGDDAEADAETPDERRERLAREAVERLLQPEPDAAPAVKVTRDSSEADRAFAYYQRLAGF
jgi:hypothetical protein